MLDDARVLGSIELSTGQSVRWVRVTEQSGWAATLQRVLAQASRQMEPRLVKLFIYDQGQMMEVLRFYAGGRAPEYPG